MKELLKELLESLNNDIYYLDENGDKINPLDAAKSGLMIRPVDSRIEAKRQLKQKGIDLDDQELIKSLIALINKLQNEDSIISTESASRRKTYGNKFKIEKVDEYNKLKGTVSQANFAKRYDITPVTFISWINNYDKIKSKLQY